MPPIWFERNRCSMQKVQNTFIRTVFNRSHSPSIESCQVLLGVQPIDILSMSINIKFLIKFNFANDLLTAARESSVLRQKSVPNVLESHLRRFAKHVNNDSKFYTVDKINDFIELMWRHRWSASDNNSFLKSYTVTTPSYNHFTPFLNHSKYEANKICELVFGNFFTISDYAWKKSKKASHLCDCGASKETAVHYFLNCKVYNEFRPEKIDKLNLLCEDDCDEMEKFKLETKKLNKDEEV